MFGLSGVRCAHGLDRGPSQRHPPHYAVVYSSRFLGCFLLAVCCHFVTISEPMSSKSQALSTTIVIPVFNDQDHLKKCLQAIVGQTIMPDEVIVVDNNSTDDSVRVAKSFPFVRLIHEKKQGVLYARNAGFNAAKSDIIGRIDADTQLPPEWTERVISIFQQTDIAAVSGPVGFHDAPARVVGLFLDKNIRRITWRLGSKGDAVFLFGSNMALRKSAWQTVHKDVCDRKDVHEDVDLAIHLFQADLAIAFDDDLSAYTSSRRMNDPSVQMKKYLDVYKNTYTVHDIKSPAIGITTTIVLAGQYGVKLIKRGYDPKTRQFSLKKFIDNQADVRVHPM